MKQFSVIPTIVALCSVLFQECAGYSTEDHSVNIPTYTECGGVIPLIWNDKGASARVSYKNGTLYNSGEFCVWTFFAEDAGGEVRIEFRDNFQDYHDGIVVYTWEQSDFINYTIPHGNSELTIESQHFAVAFSSFGFSESTGFYFDVIVERAGDGGKSPKAYFSGQDTGEFTYPKDIGHDYYDDNEQVSVVLHGLDTTDSREYGLRDLDTEENSDFVDVYTLRPYSDYYGHYYFEERFSGQQSGAVNGSDVYASYPMLYLFFSDGSRTGRGFTITWEWLCCHHGSTPWI